MTALEVLRPVDTTTLQLRVYSAIRENIMEGRFQPGASFTIRALASTLGTSVMPVREALSRLQAEGALEVQLPSRQVAIPVMSRESVAELYEVRVELEGLAAAKAVLAASSSDIASIEASNRTIHEAIAAGDEGLFLAANRVFHFGVYRAARSHHLMPMIETLWLKFGPLLRIPMQPASRIESRLMERTQEHHETIIRALKARDPAVARRGIESDLNAARRWFAANYEPARYRVSGSHAGPRREFPPPGAVRGS